MRRTNVLIPVALGAFLAADASAYCLTGVRWPATTDVFYNPAGKVTTGQCISASQMDSAVTLILWAVLPAYPGLGWLVHSEAGLGFR